MSKLPATIASRKRAAAAAGENRYEGVKCPHDGTTTRYTKSSICCECAKRVQRKNWESTAKPKPDPKPERRMPDMVVWLQREPWRLMARR